MGGGTFDIYRVCERMARIDVGVATAVLATFLGSDPITRRRHARAEEAVDDPHRRRGPAHGVRRHRARGRERPRGAEDGGGAGHRRTAWSSATASRGASSGSPTAVSPTSTRSSPTRPAGRRGSCSTGAPTGSPTASPENKHGIRLSNTAALFLDDVEVDADRLVGGVEGQGLVQAQQVFGYTRLMVAAFGLGAGWAALDRAIPYSAERIQAGGPLSEKQGYTHKLIVPHAIRLEAARAYIEETAEHIDGDEGLFNTEGAIAKYIATEAGQRRRRRRDPGARRLRLHPRVHGREDQARRADHHHLRGHVGDHGDDHRPRPVAAALEDLRPALPRAGRGTRGAAPHRSCASAPTSPRWPTTRSPRSWRPAGSLGSPATSTCCSVSASGWRGPSAPPPCRAVPRRAAAGRAAREGRPALRRRRARRR